MACGHPGEELQRVYEGTARPRSDRLFCGLCGETLYVLRSVAQPAPAPAAGVSPATAPAARQSG